ncbi:hypothetical protein WA026_018010 [Henosepilachna vigintioctopunctata]|uniref:Uncharacterized protein n=1 Tax=Henosepilachna vigintioctopunctata TaxID=420089 RepID=A0AAW1TM68_9CUCU
MWMTVSCLVLEECAMNGTFEIPSSSVTFNRKDFVYCILQIFLGGPKGTCKCGKIEGGEGEGKGKENWSPTGGGGG